MKNVKPGWYTCWGGALDGRRVYYRGISPMGIDTRGAITCDDRGNMLQKEHNLKPVECLWYHIGELTRGEETKVVLLPCPEPRQ